jgi:hypothetical protein
MFAFIKRNKSDAKKIEFQYNKTINACTYGEHHNCSPLGFVSPWAKALGKTTPFV